MTSQQLNSMICVNNGVDNAIDANIDLSSDNTHSITDDDLPSVPHHARF